MGRGSGQRRSVTVDCPLSYLDMRAVAMRGVPDHILGASAGWAGGAVEHKYGEPAGGGLGAHFNTRMFSAIVR